MPAASEHHNSAAPRPHLTDCQTAGAPSYWASGTPESRRYAETTAPQLPGLFSCAVSATVPPVVSYTKFVVLLLLSVYQNVELAPSTKAMFSWQTPPVLSQLASCHLLSFILLKNTHSAEPWITMLLLSAM